MKIDSLSGWWSRLQGKFALIDFYKVVGTKFWIPRVLVTDPFRKALKRIHEPHRWTYISWSFHHLWLKVTSWCFEFNSHAFWRSPLCSEFNRPSSEGDPKVTLVFFGYCWCVRHEGSPFAQPIVVYVELDCRWFGQIPDLLSMDVSFVCCICTTKLLFRFKREVRCIICFLLNLYLKGLLPVVVNH